MRKHSYSMVFVAVFLLLFTFTPSIHADSGKTYGVGTDSLHVRSSPDFDAEIVGKVNSGDTVTAFDERHGWVQTYYDGQEVWIASQYLFETDEVIVQEQETSNSNSSIKITEDSVHLRTGAGTDHKVLALAANGDTYDLVETSGDWHKVKLDDGSTAWVASWLTNQPTTSKETSSSKKQSSSSANNTTKKSSSNSSSQTLAGYNIMLDPSHGGKDPGAIGINGEQEKDFALEYANVVAQKLRDQGATVLLTRSTDTYVSLEDRVNISEAYWTDAFISLHFNAFTSNASNGVSTHYYSNDADYELAQHIQAGLDKHTSLRSRGTEKDPYHVLRENSDASVLVELGFLTNPNDLSIIHSSNHSSAVADAISEGLSEYLNN